MSKKKKQTLHYVAFAVQNCDFIELLKFARIIVRTLVRSLNSRYYKLKQRLPTKAQTIIIEKIYNSTDLRREVFQFQC